ATFDEGGNIRRPGGEARVFRPGIVSRGLGQKEPAAHERTEHVDEGAVVPDDVVERGVIPVAPGLIAGDNFDWLEVAAEREVSVLKVAGERREGGGESIFGGLPRIGRGDPAARQWRNWLEEGLLAPLGVA